MAFASLILLFLSCNVKSWEWPGDEDSICLRQSKSPFTKKKSILLSKISIIESQIFVATIEF